MAKRDTKAKVVKGRVPAGTWQSPDPGIGKIPVAKRAVEPRGGVKRPKKKA